MPELLPIGTRVRLRDEEHPERVGKIIGHEYQRSGELSGLPYKVLWDDEAIHGMWPYWPRPECLELEEESVEVEVPDEGRGESDG